MKVPGRDLGVVVLGDARVALAADGPVEEAHLYRRTLSGGALLTAVAAARMGVEAALVARVGDDAFGEWLLERGEAEHLHLDYARQHPGRTPLELVGAGSRGRGSVAYPGSPAVETLEPSDVQAVPWDMARHVLAPGSGQALGADARRTMVAAFEEAAGRGVVTVHDPWLHAGLWPDDDMATAREAFDAIVPLTDLLILGAPFAAGRLLARPQADEAAREALRRGARRAVIRMGHRGCVVAEGVSVTRIEGVEPPEVRDPGAAAAAFDGALVAALTLGRTLRDAAAVALEAMALAMAGGPGPDGLPWLDQLNALRADRDEPPLG
ncbi:MAG: carbohydrate kinase family protein [Myxococcota bacterium]